MHIEYRVNESDFVGASMLALRKRSSWSALDYYFPHIFCVLWLAGSVIPSPFNHYGQDDLDLLLTLGVFPIFMGLIVLRRRRLKQDYKKMKNLKLHQALDLDSNGLRLTTTDGVARSSWDLYTKFVEDKNSFILYQKLDHGILIIPKQHLTEGQADELRNLLVARMAMQEE
jgi:hypothetical protein